MQKYDWDESLRMTTLVMNSRPVSSKQNQLITPAEIIFGTKGVIRGYDRDLGNYKSENELSQIFQARKEEKEKALKILFQIREFEHKEVVSNIRARQQLRDFSEGKLAVEKINEKFRIVQIVTILNTRTILVKRMDGKLTKISPLNIYVI